jgi:hypothetical protein
MFVTTVRELKEIVNQVPEKELDSKLYGLIEEGDGGSISKAIYLDKGLLHCGDWDYQIKFFTSKEALENFDKDREWDETFPDII